MTVVEQTELLRAEEEVELAQAIEAGLLAQEKLAAGGIKDPMLLMDLHRVVRRGRDANERFVLANVRLVHFWARRRMLAGANGDLSLEDLIAEGMVGLVHAVEMFDFTLGVKFSTYSTYWIRQKMGRAAARNTAATIPFATLERLAQLHTASEDLRQDLKRPPTAVELAAELRTTTRAVLELQQISRRAVSLDLSINVSSSHSGSDTSLGDLIPSQGPGPDDQVCAAELPDRIRALVSILSDREQHVLALRFGLFGHGPHTVDEAARRLDVDPTRVRQALTGALDKLRSGAHAEDLYVFLEAA